jgi:hypothetical protein
MKKLIIGAGIATSLMIAWSGKESSEQKNINFYGSIETHEGQRWYIQNIGIGRDREEAKHRNIVMYDKPHDIAVQEDEMKKKMLPKNPGSMSYSEIDLSEVKELLIAADASKWLYKKAGDRYGIEYIEATVIHKDGKASSFLIELGREDLPKKTKLFCSIRHTKDAQNPPVVIGTEKGDMFCKGVTVDELEEKGIPFEAVKVLSIEGFCHQVVPH